MGLTDLERRSTRLELCLLVLLKRKSHLMSEIGGNKHGRWDLVHRNLNSVEFMSKVYPFLPLIQAHLDQILLFFALLDWCESH